MAITLWPSVSQAGTPHEVVLTPQPIRLSGTRTHASIGVFVDESAAPAYNSQLELWWRASPLLDPETSIITIAIDEVPQTSRRLADLDPEAPLLVDMGRLSAGMHSLEIHGKLEVDGDECLENFERESWLVLEPESAVRWESLEGESESILSDFPRRWLTSDTDEQVSFYAPQADTKEAALVRLVGDQMLRDWSVEFEHVERMPRQAKKTLVLSTPEDAVGKALMGMKRDLEQHDVAIALIESDEAHLRVMGKDVEALEQAITVLRLPSSREICDQKRCWIAPETAERLSELDSQDEAEHPTRVLTLSDLGHMSGWNAEGRGLHVLEFVWVKPGDWKLKRWPELTLPIRYGKSARLDKERSSVRLRINGQPIISYTLSEIDPGGKEALVIRVPEEFWEDDAWVTRIEFDLSTTEEERCRRDDDEFLWVALGRNFRLDVPRKQPEHKGMAQLADRLADLDPRVVWNGPIDVGGLAALGAVLYPLREAGNTQQVVFVGGEDGCGGWCVVPHNTPPEGARMSIRDGASDRYWSDSMGELPLLPLGDSVYVHYRKRGRAERLDLVPGTFGEEVDVIPALPYARVAGGDALYAGAQWRDLPGDEEIRGYREVESEASGPVSESSDRPVSREEKTLRKLNIIWAIVSFIVVGGGLYALRRYLRAQAPKQSEEKA